MEHLKAFNYFEQKTIDKAGKVYKQHLLNGLEDDREFSFLSNNFIKEINKRENELFPISNQELISLLSIFKNRARYYKANWDEKIFKNELFQEYKRSPVRKEITYKELIFKVAVYNGLKKVQSIHSKNSFYKLIYNKNEFKKYIFLYDFNSINKAERKLLNKYYPNRESGYVIDFSSDSDNSNSEINTKNKVKKVNDDIDLFGVMFNLNEFALYNREWKNFKKHNDVSLKDIFDKVMIDFNDPYNYIKSNRNYDGTPFYKALQEDNPIDKRNFKVELAYNKIIDLAKKTGNKKFLKHIEERKELMKN